MVGTFITKVNWWWWFWWSIYQESLPCKSLTVCTIFFSQINIQYINTISFKYYLKLVVENKGLVVGGFLPPSVEKYE